MELNYDEDAAPEQEQKVTNEINYSSVPPLQVKRADEDPYNATYTFLNEDHTLGVLLRSEILKNNHVQFCAYSVPHPSEPFMNVRIQCNEDGSQHDTKKVLNHGLKRITKMCDVLDEKFADKLRAFKAAQ